MLLKYLVVCVMSLDIYLGRVSSVLHSDTDSTIFPIKIISATTEADWEDTTYSVEFETKTKLKARTTWFSYYNGQKYPIVFGDPTFSSSLSPNKNRYIARLRARGALGVIQKNTVEFAVTLDQSTVTLTFDELRNSNSTTTQTFDRFEFEVSVQTKSREGNTTTIEFETEFDVSSNAKSKDQALELSRYVVKKNETSGGENEVSATRRSEKITDEDTSSYSLEYEHDNSFYLDATQIEITYEPIEDIVLKEIKMRSEYHFWEDTDQKPINGVSLFHEFDLLNVDRRPIKIAHCQAIGDVTIQIGLNGKNGMSDIPPRQIATVQINYGYFREAFALLRFYSGSVTDYEAYCNLV